MIERADWHSRVPEWPRVNPGSELKYAQVFARFRDTSQNVSADYTDTINVLPAGSFGTIQAVAIYADQPDSAGITMTSDDLIPLAFADGATGSIMQNLPAGTWDLGWIESRNSTIR